MQTETPVTIDFAAVIEIIATTPLESIVETIALQSK